MCRVAVTACVRRGTFCSVETASVNCQSAGGLNDGQMFDPDARIHVWLPALSDAQWSELKGCLQSLATLASLQIAGRHVTGAGCPNNLCDSISAMETNGGSQDFPLMEPLQVGAPE